MMRSTQRPTIMEGLVQPSLELMDCIVLVPGTCRNDLWSSLDHVVDFLILLLSIHGHCTLTCEHVFEK
jgi:hypothetical protein